MKWYLATNEVDVFHYGSMEEDMEITTGQPQVFFYTTKEDLVSALTGYGHEYQEPTELDISMDPEGPLAEPEGM